MAAKEATKPNGITEIKVDVDSCLSPSLPRAERRPPERPVSSDSQQANRQQKATGSKIFAI